eukprot:7381760-Prymnesium_polylepis.1
MEGCVCLSLATTASPISSASSSAAFSATSLAAAALAAAALAPATSVAATFAAAAPSTFAPAVSIHGQSRPQKAAACSSCGCASPEAPPSQHPALFTYAMTVMLTPATTRRPGRDRSQRRRVAAWTVAAQTE